MTTDLADNTLDLLRGISTATITMQLLKRGIRRCYMKGPMPFSGDGGRLVGPAFTLRYVPLREDLSTVEVLGSPDNPQRNTIEDMPAGHVLVIDACGVTDAGVLGDVLVGRLKHRGIAGVVSDASMRDAAGIKPIGLPIWCAGPTAPANIGGLSLGDRQVRIGCGGVAVDPGDIIVADGDGVVVIPRALADDVARDGDEQERFERFVLEKIAEGRSTIGLYPPNDETRAEYQDWLAAGGK